jgi:CHAT domain-containing protein
VIVANPEFNVSASGSVSETPEIRPLPFGAVRFSRFRFASLSATEEEANAICNTVVCDKVLTGISATKNGLFTVRGPVVLHIATHGFFIRNGDQEVENTSDKRPALDNSTRPAGNPLLRSGLALTGANASDVTHANGILTSLEASGLDLEGTELVILSACETALGDIRDGEGIYGLRRAFVVAGSKSQLTTLWKVDNDATRDVMISYYKALVAGGGRSEVLRNIKLAALNDRKHPYYWAGFIPSGYWGQVAGLSLKATSNVTPN